MQNNNVLKFILLFISSTKKKTRTQFLCDFEGFKMEKSCQNVAQLFDYDTVPNANHTRPEIYFACKLYFVGKSDVLLHAETSGIFKSFISIIIINLKLIFLVLVTFSRGSTLLGLQLDADLLFSIFVVFLTGVFCIFIAEVQQRFHSFILTWKNHMSHKISSVWKCSICSSHINVK